MTITLHRLGAAEFAYLAPRLADIYTSAMGYSPALIQPRTHSFRRDCIQPGFSAVIAHRNSQLLGFGYGFLGSPDTWWDRQLRSHLYSLGGPTPDQARALSNYFELAELHVHPAWQGQGIGKQLLVDLLSMTSASTCLLSTPEVAQEDNRAFGLYRSVGFEDFVRNLIYPTDTRSFAVLKAALPLAANEST